MKTCPYCAEQIQDAAIKCRYCGSMLGDAPSVGPPVDDGLALQSELQPLIDAGKTIEAIKLARRRRGFSLLQAKTYVEAMQGGRDPQFAVNSLPPKARGCTPAAALVIAVSVLVALLTGERITRAQAGDPHQVTAEQYARWKTDLSNWGRWGKDDEIGALNLITPAKRRQAAALVREGVSVSLAADADTVKAVDNPNPYEVTWIGISSDRISVEYHGIAHTHLDSLAHINERGVFYNGYRPQADEVARQGHSKNSIHNVKNGVFTRGILIDIPRLKGVPYLEPGTPIYVEDLEAWEKQTGVRVSAGDALFVRTGVWARRKAVGPWLRGRAEGGRSAGLDPSVIPWLRARDVAILGSDHPQYVSPGPSGAPRGAVHDFALVYLGVHLFDNCDLEALAEAAASRKRWEFLLTAAPLPIPGGTGSPINPIATF